MKRFVKRVRQLYGAHSGTTGIEYATIASLISVAAIVAMGGTGDGVGTKFREVFFNVAAALKGNF